MRYPYLDRIRDITRDMARDPRPKTHRVVEVLPASAPGASLITPAPDLATAEAIAGALRPLAERYYKSAAVVVTAAESRGRGWVQCAPVRGYVWYAARWSGDTPYPWGRGVLACEAVAVAEYTLASPVRVGRPYLADAGYRGPRRPAVGDAATLWGRPLVAAAVIPVGCGTVVAMYRETTVDAVTPIIVVA